MMEAQNNISSPF